MTVAEPGTAVPEPVFDADTIPPEELGERLPDIPPGTRTVRGVLFTTPDGVRAALDAGVGVIVAEHRLPVLLSAVAHRAVAHQGGSS